MTRSAAVAWFLLGLGLMMGAIGCAENPGENPSWRPTYAFPLVNSTFTVSEIINELDENGVAEVDPDQLVHLIYEGNIFSRAVNDLVQIPDFQTSVIAGAGHLPNGFQGFGRLDVMRLKAGQLRLVVESFNGDAVDFSLSLPGLTKDGSAFLLDTTWSGSLPLLFDLDLTDYEWTAEEDGFAFEVIAKIAGEDTDALIGGSLQWESLSYSYLEGIFEAVSILSPPDTVEIDLFKSQASGTLFFEEFSMDLTIRNGLGIPLVGRVAPLQASTNRSGVLNIEAGPVNSGLELNYPSLNEVGQEAETFTRLNETNSNLNEVIAAAPKEVRYQVLGEVDKMENPGFLSDQSTFGLDMRIDLPLHVRAENFGLADTLPFNMSEIQDLAYIESGSFRIQAINGFPIEMNMQVIFMDDQAQVLDSLFEGDTQLLRSAPIDNEGRVIQSDTLSVDIDIPASKYDILPSVRQVDIRFSSNSVQNGTVPVRIFEDYTIGLNIGIKATINPADQ
ncbi:MAG: hypothetical protein AAF399_00440 [Bacteroidota bacterium]